jgi:YCII-related domain
MPRFIFTYRSAKSYDAMTDPDSMAAWGTFLNEVIAPNVEDPGYPVFEPSTVIGDAGLSTRLGGYSIISADDLETALSIAKQCPAIKNGGGVEVGVLAALPQEHPAEQIRSQLESA